MVYSREKLFALFLALGLAGGGAVAGTVAAAPHISPLSSNAVMTASPQAGDANCDDAGENEISGDVEEQDDVDTGTPTADRNENENDDQNEQEDSGDVEEQNDDSGTSSADNNEQEDQNDGDVEEQDDSGTPTAGSNEHENDDADCVDAAATPGTLNDGADLLSQATITLDQAIATAQSAATRTLGQVDLEEGNGTLYFSVEIGDQEVRVDAKTGDVIETVPGE